MTSWILKTKNVKIQFSGEGKELLKWNKKYFSYFDKFDKGFRLNFKKKLAKM